MCERMFDGRVHSNELTVPVRDHFSFDLTHHDLQARIIFLRGFYRASLYLSIFFDLPAQCQVTLVDRLSKW